MGCGKQRVPHLSIPSKTAALVPEFAVEDLPLSRTAALVLEFGVKYLPLGRILMMMMMMMMEGQAMRKEDRRCEYGIIQKADLATTSKIISRKRLFYGPMIIGTFLLLFKPVTDCPMQHNPF